MTTKILVVDDDRFLQDSLKRLLTGQGFEVRTQSTAEDGLQSIISETPDLMILDLGLPGVDGISFCRQIRTKWKFPVLMLTARTDAMDKVIGLEVGADDYLTKPFEPSELLARVRAQLRRNREYHEAVAPKPKVVQVGKLQIDVESREARFAGKPLELTVKEYELLLYMAQNVGRALSREMLFEEVWGFEIDFNSNSLDVFVYRLRQKLESEHGAPRYIFTQRGFGYKLQAPD